MNELSERFQVLMDQLVQYDLISQVPTAMLVDMELLCDAELQNRNSLSINNASPGILGLWHEYAELMENDNEQTEDPRPQGGEEEK